MIRISLATSINKPCFRFTPVLFLVLTFLLISSAKNEAVSADWEDEMTYGIGILDPLDDANSLAAEIGYALNTRLGFLNLGPQIELLASINGGFWLGAGGHATVYPTDRIFLTYQFGAGFHKEGRDMDLGHPLIFQNRARVGYDLDETNSLGLTFGHYSNADRGNRNPGLELLSFQLIRRFDPKPAREPNFAPR